MKYNSDKYIESDTFQNEVEAWQLKEINHYISEFDIKLKISHFNSQMTRT